MPSGVIVTLADAAVDDQFVDAECEDGSEIVVVIGTATLANLVLLPSDWLMEIQCDRIAYTDCFVTDLASRLAICCTCYA